MHDPSSLSREQIDALAHAIMTDKAIIDSATYQLLDKIRRFDEAKGWARQGAKTCPDWLTWRTGVNLPTARQHVRVAHRLPEFPRIADAFRKGELSYTKVRACVREGMPPEKDQVLLHHARGASGSQLERICAAYRRCAPGTKLTDEDRRHVRKSFHRDGTVTISIRVLPDEAERLYQAIAETRRAMAEQHDGSAEPSPTPAAPTLADAAMAIAETQLSRLRDEEKPKSAPAAERRQLFVHLREERIEDDSSWRAELHDGTPLSGESLKRLACDCSLVGVKTDDHGDPLDVGRKRRTVSQQLLRALFVRDRGCQFPGCNERHQAFLDAHHIQHWLDGGPTSKSNTALVCSAHHVALHEGGFRAERLPDGSLHFFDPHGREIDAHPPAIAPSEPGETVLRNRAEKLGLQIDHNTNMVQHNGVGLDLHAAVDALFTHPRG